LNLNEAYRNAMSYDQYVDSLGDYLSLHRLHYKKFSIESDFESMIKNFKPTKILVITEPWCGDSLAIIPIIKKIAEMNTQWEMRVVRRDTHMTLMEKFLTKGTKAIPIFIFLNNLGEMLFRWGPRPNMTTQIFDDHREQIKQGQIDKQEVIKKIRTFYAKDRGRTTFLELIEVFNLHLN